MSDHTFYELNADEFYAYGYENEVWAFMHFEVLLRDPAEPGLLREAAALAFARYPYFDTALSSEPDPERIVLRRSARPVPVVESAEDLPPEVRGPNGHLVAIAYAGRTLRIRISHIVTDGCGAKAFLSTLLRDYFQLKYEAKTADEIRRAIPDEPPPSEYDNPFDYIDLPAYTYRLRPKKAFVFPAEEVDDSAKSRIRFSVPQEELLRFSKSQESSVSAVASWLLLRAVFAAHPQASSVSAAVPYDVRKVLGCPQNMRNCNTTIRLNLPRGYVSRSSEEQLTALRGELFLQMDAGCALPLMDDARLDWQEACRAATIRKRTAYYHGGDNLDSYPIVSYIGSMDLGEYEPYYEQAHCITKVSGQAGFLMMIFSNQGAFHFNITTTLKDPVPYLQVMLALLDQNGIPHTQPDIRSC